MGLPFKKKDLRLRTVVVLGLSCLLVASACVSSKRKPAIVQARSGEFVENFGFSVDANYDPRLDTLVPNYKLVTVALRNTSLSVIRMDPRKDKWVLVNGDGKRIRAKNSLRLSDRKAWSRLRPKVRLLMDYPDVVPVSYTATFNLFFKTSAPLAEVREIHYWNHHWGQEFLILKD